MPRFAWGCPPWDTPTAGAEPSRATCAELVGVHEIDVSRYERGEVDPSLHTLVALARVLELDVRELLKSDGG